MRLRAAKHKYHAQKCKRDSINFASKLERSCFDLLTSLKNSGKILFFLRQIGIDIGAGHRYICDYLAFTTEECYFLEVKGKMAPGAQMKINLAQEAIGVEIHVVHKPEEILAVLFGNLAP